MNGYLQCLIDQYKRLAENTPIPAKRIVYSRVLDDLVGLQNFYKVRSESETVVENTPKKHMVAEFVGTIPDLMEYLKNLNFKGGK